MENNNRFAFVSSCPEKWGGSEELWCGAAVHLARENHKVCAFKTNVDYQHTRIQLLESSGCSVSDLVKMRFPVPVRLVNRFLPYPFYYTEHKSRSIMLARQLKIFQPDLIVISQGENFDGIWYAEMCRTRGFPYALISQKVVEHQWPLDALRPVMQEVYKSAVKAFFVSNHNQKITENQIGFTLENAEVVHNPYLTKVAKPIAWSNGDGLNLACVARLWIMDKGQDILIRVLAKEKWKQRNIRVSFYGEGLNREGLIDLAKALGVNNVCFQGQSGDVISIWKENHALVLPSRSEGLPLVLVEAMMCGRPAIVTNVGGIPEVLEDEQTGFIASAATEDAFDEALERAWERRHDWEEMGLRAARRIRELIPEDPAAIFAGKLLSSIKN